MYDRLLFSVFEKTTLKVRFLRTYTNLKERNRKMRISLYFSGAVLQPVIYLGVSLHSDRIPASRKARSCSSSIATGENCHVQLQLTPLHLLNANKSALLARTHSEGHQSQRESVSKPRPKSDPWTERLTWPKEYLKNPSYQFAKCQCLKFLSSTRLKIQILLFLNLQNASWI